MLQWTESPVSVRVLASVLIWVAMARWTESPVSVIVLWMLASVRIWAVLARPPGVQSYKCQSDSSLFLQQRGIMRWEIMYLDNLSINSPSIYRYSRYIYNVYNHICPGDLSTSMWVSRDDFNFQPYYSHSRWRIYMSRKISLANFCTVANISGEFAKALKMTFLGLKTIYIFIIHTKE